MRKWKNEGKGGGIPHLYQTQGAFRCKQDPGMKSFKHT